MTKEQQAHLSRVLTAHTELTTTKYVNGQKEHGGNCWEKPGMLAHALDESADLPVYLHTLAQQMRELVCHLRTGNASADSAADEIERWLQK